MPEQDESENSKYKEKEDGKRIVQAGRRKCSPGVKQDMQKDGKPDGTSFLTDVSQNQTDKKCVDSLNQVHMKNAE